MLHLKLALQVALSLAGLLSLALGVQLPPKFGGGALGLVMQLLFASLLDPLLLPEGAELAAGVLLQERGLKASADVQPAQRLLLVGKVPLGLAMCLEGVPIRKAELLRIDRP